MKKIFALIMVLALVLTLCACGKSEEVKTIEGKIAALSSESTYKEINDVYVLYKAIEIKDREKIENQEVLSEYISLSNGSFKLTDDMVSEIEDYFDSDTYGLYAFSGLSTALTVAKLEPYGADWDRIGDYEWSSEEKTDDYTYTKYGRVEVQDKYGNTEIHDFEMDCTFVYDEDEGTYVLSKSAEILE